MFEKRLICGSIFLIWILNFCHSLNCRSKEKPAYLRSIGYKLDERNGASRRTDSVAECKKLCSSMAFCEFAVYNTFGKMCTIVKSAGQQQNGFHGKDFIATSTDLELYQKICIEKTTMSCPNDLVRTPQKLLVGFARKIFSDVPTVAACIAKCLPKDTPMASGVDPDGASNDDNESFDCVSFIYYYDEKSCIVNSASASVHPDLFVSAPEEKEGRFDYFDNTCYEGWTEWTRWSPCLPKNDPSQNQGLRFRQRSCNAWNGRCGRSFSTPSPTDDGQSDHQAENCDLQTTTISVGLTTPGFTGQQLVTEPHQPPAFTTEDKKRPCKGQHYLYLDCNGYCINFRELGYPNYPDCLRGGAKNATVL